MDILKRALFEHYVFGGVNIVLPSGLCPFDRYPYASVFNSGVLRLPPQEISIHRFIYVIRQKIRKERETHSDKKPRR